MSAKKEASKQTIIFRPLEAKFNLPDSPKGKIDAYCRVRVGWHGGKTTATAYKGKNPTWADSITVERKLNEKYAKIIIKDKDKTTLNDAVGTAEIDLDEVVVKGKTAEWYNLYKHHKMIGSVLIGVEHVAQSLYDFAL